MNKVTLNLLLLFHSTVRNCAISKSASCMDVPWSSHARSAKRAPQKTLPRRLFKITRIQRQFNS